MHMPITIFRAEFIHQLLQWG